jgi:SNF2 family DNA or RNA helicase
VFLIQIKAGGVGLNLQEATRVYITCPAWNPATELQAIGRAHRTGQTQKVVVRRLIYMGEDGVEPLPSVEQSIMQLQEGKAKVCAEVLNDPKLETQVPNVTRTKITIHALRKIFAV